MSVSKTSSLLISFMIATAPTVHCFKPAEMPENNAWHLMTYPLDPTEFPLMPQEKDIKNFPEPVAEDEKDPQTLAKYYEAVAKAYADQAEEQKNRVKESTVNLQRQQDRLFVDTLRSPISYSSLKVDPLNRARANSVRYNKQTYIPSHSDAQIFEKKAEFYQEIADYWNTVKE